MMHNELRNSLFKFIRSFFLVLVLHIVLGLHCISLFSLLTLGAIETRVPVHSEAAEDIILEYEQSGNYAKALDVARKAFQEFRKQHLNEKASEYFVIVNRLENKLLTLGNTRLLFDEKCRPRFKLLQLLEELGMGSLKDKEDAILEINSWAQANLLRQGERWNTQTCKFENIKSKIQPLLDELGFINASIPHFKDYQGAIVHGGYLLRVQLRLNYLVDQWKQGVRFSFLYFLSGERPLEEQEVVNLISKGFFRPELECIPKTECEMVQLVWERSYIPQEMRRGVQVYFINAPMQKNSGNENPQRPTTETTVEYWLKADPPSGRYLAVTNAPYVSRQDAVIRAIAPKKYSFETIGFGASTEEATAIFLDEVARFIYQTKTTCLQ